MPASKGTVLLKDNDSTLPLNSSTTKSIAVIGPMAAMPPMIASSLLTSVGGRPWLVAGFVSLPGLVTVWCVLRSPETHSPHITAVAEQNRTEPGLTAST